MKVIAWIGGIILAVFATVIIASAIIPEKDCNGNNTWDQDKVCTTTK